MNSYRRLGVIVLLSALAAGGLSLAAVRSAKAVNVVGGFTCSPMSGGGTTTTTTCKYFGDRQWLVSHHVAPRNVCGFTATFDNAHWDLDVQFSLVAGRTVQIAVLSGASIVSEEDLLCGGGGDGRVNPGHGDHIAAVYVDRDDHANPDLKLYCIFSEGGAYGGQITRAMLDAVPQPPSTNTLVATIETCSHPVSLYALTTGEFQLNFGPDAEGHTAVMVFTGLPPHDIYFYDIHLFEDNPS